MDPLDRDIINHLQGGFPIAEEPYAPLAAQWGVPQEEILARIRRLLDERVLTRFGPLYHAERMGGALTLAAMAVPENAMDDVAAILADMPEVAHNYARDHWLSMWFVVATETRDELLDTLFRIEERTGLQVYNMPKKKEFYVGLRFEA